MSLIIVFFAGMLTLFSPCTLPVIPLVFASVRGRKGQSAALLAGMVIMFVMVALLVNVASQWVADITVAGRNIALIFLALSGLALMFPRIAQFVTGPLVRLGNVINQTGNRRSGMISALLSGLAIGLLWSPCAGPVLGAILSVAIADKTSLSIGLLLAAYCSGCAAMLAILLAGVYRVMRALRPGLAVRTHLQTLTGGLMLISVGLIASGNLSVLHKVPAFAMRMEQQLSQHLNLQAPAVKLQPVADIEDNHSLPSLDGGTQWFNSPPLTNTALKGKVVLVEFWTSDCINCQHTLPYVRDWANKYQKEGLVVVGIHTPEFPDERLPETVEKSLQKWQLTYPIVADNNYTLWNRFGNQYWPAHYIFDTRGQLRYVALGEGNYAQQEKVIRQLLKDARV